jgi:hypothetical protein
VPSNASTNNNERNSAQNDHNDAENDESESDSGYVKKVKKGISKKTYEPIIDSNVVYRFEENPNEYMRARK